MYKNYLKALTVISCLSIATQYPNVQAGLGLCIKQQTFNADIATIENNFGIAINTPELNLSLAAIQNINPLLGLSLDSKLSASPIFNSSYMGVSAHIGDNSQSTLNLGLGITSIHLPSLPIEHLALEITGNIISPTLSAGITTILLPNVYTTFEVFMHTAARISDNVHINSIDHDTSQINKLLEVFTISQGGLNLSVGYAL
ncbi:hypothetical protein OAT84_02930 [Gammaproteobacteria bacterium]|nr:hypothetical protein [Gammaproteobacteria bacterium]